MPTPAAQRVHLGSLHPGRQDDDRHAMMTAGNAQEGVRCLCYEDQAHVVEPLLKPGALVLDVGCGPTLPYTNRPTRS